MRAMVLDRPGEPLRMEGRPTPRPGPGEILVAVAACAVCRTDLHVVDGELPDVRGPLIPGHEIVGRVLELGAGVSGLVPGQRVGVPWLGHTCGHCRFCLSGRENLCDEPLFTGYTRDGGYATHVVADAAYAFPLPDLWSDIEAAPLMCAGLIGHRTLTMAGDARVIGIYGFGAAAHICAQLCVAEGRRLYAFTTPGDTKAQEFARSLGCVWAGGSDEPSPEPLEAALIFAPAGPLVPKALRDVMKGGTVVCGGIHMSDIPGFPYRDLWGERVIRSVANLTRADGENFLARAAEARVKTTVVPYPLSWANTALADLRSGRLTGAAVLVPSLDPEEGP